MILNARGRAHLEDTHAASLEGEKGEDTHMAVRMGDNTRMAMLSGNPAVAGIEGEDMRMAILSGDPRMDTRSVRLAGEVTDTHDVELDGSYDYTFQTITGATLTDSTSLNALMIRIQNLVLPHGVWTTIKMQMVHGVANTEAMFVSFIVTHNIHVYHQPINYRITRDGSVVKSGSIVDPGADNTTSGAYYILDTSPSGTSVTYALQVQPATSALPPPTFELFAIQTEYFPIGVGDTHYAILTGSEAVDTHDVVLRGVRIDDLEPTLIGDEGIDTHEAVLEGNGGILMGEAISAFETGSSGASTRCNILTPPNGVHDILTVNVPEGGPGRVIRMVLTTGNLGIPRSLFEPIAPFQTQIRIIRNDEELFSTSRNYDTIYRYYTFVDETVPTEAFTYTLRVWTSNYRDPPSGRVRRFLVGSTSLFLFIFNDTDTHEAVLTGANVDMHHVVLDGALTDDTHVASIEGMDNRMAVTESEDTHVVSLEGEDTHYAELVGSEGVDTHHAVLDGSASPVPRGTGNGEIRLTGVDE